MATRVYDRAYNEFYLNNAMNTLATMLDYAVNIKREDMEYTNENGYSVKVVLDPTLCMVMDLFHRIEESDRLDKHLTIICPNQWPAAYSAVRYKLRHDRWQEIFCRHNLRSHSRLPAATAVIFPTVIS